MSVVRCTLFVVGKLSKLYDFIIMQLTTNN